eukprot:comp22459_c0_seq2/m.33781 comp22459_c0_seq2/g.33781  ORF comp22459_c0_seq2/g.33781 comp22459_c0_seq2/m.33781 type:complete len:363 (-) comp22459_c0_seq2:126-1214(-)
MVQVQGFVHDLLVVSEKAAEVARAIRREKALFSLLIEDKKDEGNKRFFQDFKTFADVLIQEIVKCDLVKKYPALDGHILGEEDNTFTNTEGDSVTVTVADTKQATYEIILKAVGGQTDAATLLADIIHGPTAYIPMDPNLYALSGAVDPSNLGIWIDPIDGTNEYIKGGEGDPTDGIYDGGLPVCEVVIGAFDRTTGHPVMGVVNSPFVLIPSVESHWVWGVATANQKAHSPGLEHLKNPKTIVMSGSESDAIKDGCRGAGFGLRLPAGAGYKLLCVASGVAGAYLLSKGSTFKWDTCAPHAILLAIGGDLVGPDGASVRYHQPDDPHAPKSEIWANSRGILATRDPTVAAKLLEIWNTARR